MENNTPNIDNWKSKVDKIAAVKEKGNKLNFAPGDYIAAKTTGNNMLAFVVSETKSSILVETLYGSWGGQDAMIQYFKVKKSNVIEHYKAA